jgi:polar amino acid transport system substrate-binding protein
MLRAFPFLFALIALPAKAADVTFLVDTGTEMPMARFQGWEMVGGIHYDVGMALAKAMGRTARFTTLPRQRMAGALEQGSADVVCGYVPQWFEGNFGWSQPFLPTVEVLLTNAAAQRPRALKEVAFQTIGTVHGYHYPELEKGLGADFIRENGPNTEASLRKLAVGRMSHVVTSEYIYYYRKKQGDLAIVVHPPLLIKRWATQCAISRKGSVSVAEVNSGIAAMLRAGTLDSIIARYR